MRIFYVFFILGLWTAVRSEDDEAKILGGEVENEQMGRYPYVVSLKRESVDGLARHHFCGGTIINVNWVLTAAYCVFTYDTDDKARKMFVYAGIVNIVNERRAQNHNGLQISRIIEKYPHPFYNEDTREYNIALLYLKTPLQFTQYVQPAKLPEQPLDYSKEMKILGWGPYNTTDGWGLVSSSNLIVAKVPIRPYKDSRCNISWPLPERPSAYEQQVVCVGEYGLTACSSDLGGPLVDEDHMLYGIASVLVAKCDEPSVYLNIRPFVRSFIQPLIDTRVAIKKNQRETDRLKSIPKSRDQNRRKAAFLVSIHSHLKQLPHVREKICSGTYIDDQWIITAAHCLDLDRSNGEGLFILIGVSTHWGNSWERNLAEFVQVSKTFKHPNYVRGEVANDIALLHLKSPALERYHDNLNLPKNENYEPERMLSTSGYTITPGYEDPLRDPLGNGHIVIANVIKRSSKKCVEHLFNVNEEDILCYAHNSTYPCESDSGGPLYDKQSETLVGVTTLSYGYCGTHPEPYVPVSKHLNWIKTTMANNNSTLNKP